MNHLYIIFAFFEYFVYNGNIVFIYIYTTMVENLANNYQIEANNKTEDGINGFPQTWKFLDRVVKDPDKKNIIQNVLQNNKFEDIFEEILWSKNRSMCIDDLLKWWAPLFSY